MTDWATVAASGATAVGTLVLAGATFAAVRSSERKRSCPPRQYPPVVVTSRPDDPTQRIGFQDEHWIEVAGGRGAAEVGDEAIYLVMSLRNVGSGFAVLDRWRLVPDLAQTEVSLDDLDDFQRLTRDIYVPAGDVGFWQGSLREPGDPMFEQAKAVISERRPFLVDLSRSRWRSAHGQPLPLSPNWEHLWLIAVARHWNRPPPR